MSLIKSKKEQKAMIEAGKRLAQVFEKLSFENLLGKTTKQCDLMIKKLLDSFDLKSMAYGYHGFRGYSCISVNDVIVHGVPHEQKIIHEADFVKVDICVQYNGYCADMARPFYDVNNASETIRLLNKCAWESIDAGIAEARDGAYLDTLSRAIENVIKKYSFSVVTMFSGHGIGKNMHEEPLVPNYGGENEAVKLYEGMCLAIEPMFCEKNERLVISSADKWSAYAADNGLTCHIEDTIIVTSNEPIITTRL